MRIRSLAMLALAASSLPAVPVAQAPASPTAPAAPASPAPASAPSEAAPATQAEVRSLAEEVRRLKLEMSVPDVIQFGTYAGQGAGASKTHFAPKGLSIGGYGELVYVNYADDRADYAEVLRLVLYVGYRFTDRIVFIAPKFHDRMDRLAALGVVPGSELRLHQRAPAFVIEVGETTIALDPEIAGEVYVKRLEG